MTEVEGVSSTQRCMDAYVRRYLFFKDNSGALWLNHDRWQPLQREGFAGECLAGGGRFFFGVLSSNYITTDLGICAPSGCEDHDMKYYLFPEMHRHFFAQPDVQFALVTREYRAVTPERVLALPPWVLAVLGAAMLLALLSCLHGLLSPAVAAAPSRELASGGTGAEAVKPRPPRTAALPLRAHCFVAIALREVARRTRWKAYDWHESHSSVFRLAGAVDALCVDHALCGAQAFHLAQLMFFEDRPLSALPRGRRVLATTVARLGYLFALSGLWVAVGHAAHELLTVNVHSVMSAKALTLLFLADLPQCANVEPGAALLFAGLTPSNFFAGFHDVAEDLHPCPHLLALTRELRMSLVLAPLALLAALTPLSPAVMMPLLALLLSRLDGGVTPEMAAGMTAVLAVEVRRLATVSCRLGPLATRSLSGLLLLGLALGLRAAGHVDIHADTLAAAATPLLLEALAPLLAACAAALPLLGALERHLDGALPALPLFLFALEGVLSCALGGLAYEVASVTTRLIRSVCGTSLRIGLDAYDGASLCSVRIPLVCIAPLIAAACFARTRLELF